MKAPLKRTWGYRGARSALLVATALLLAAPAGARKNKVSRDLAEIFSRMNEAAKDLKTFSANLEYTKVTLLVNDKSTELGQIFYHKSKNPEVLINLQKPEPRVILFKKNKAEIYAPKINQIQEYNLEQHSGLVQQFFLLGFGTEMGELKKSFTLKFVTEEELDGDTTAVLELTPRKKEIEAQLSKVLLWISEESWLPVQQKFVEPGGDYLIARYTAVKVNRRIPSSTFRIAAKGAKRVKMN